MTTIQTLTDTQIAHLRAEAASAGDLLTVRVCDRALTGSQRARRECVRVIRDAEAQK